MSDLISRQEAIDKIFEFFGESYIGTTIKELLKSIPSAEPGWSELLVICDNCGHAIHVKEEDTKPKPMINKEWLATLPAYEFYSEFKKVEKEGQGYNSTPLYVIQWLDERRNLQ